MSERNRDRAAWIARAEYYGWSALKPWPTPGGNDPATGRPWPKQHRHTTILGRAADAALCRAAWRIVRQYPSPLALADARAQATLHPAPRAISAEVEQALITRPWRRLDR